MFDVLTSSCHGMAGVIRGDGRYSILAPALDFVERSRRDGLDEPARGLLA
jgi:hypothetical protein